MIKLCAFADEAGKSLAEQIAALRENGVSLMELRNVNGKNLTDFTDEEAALYAKELKENGIAVWSMGSPLGKAKTEEIEKQLALTKRVCELCKIFGTDKIRMFSFFGTKDLATVCEKLTEMAKVASSFGMTFYHENEKKIYGETAAEIKNLMAAKIPGLKFVFDPANFLQCGQDIMPALDMLFDDISYFHIKDVIEETEQLVPAGYGDGHIKELVERIVKSGRDAVLTVEPHLRVFSGYGKIDDTEMKNKFTYQSNRESFDAAVSAIKDVLRAAGLREITLPNGEKGWA